MRWKEADPDVARALLLIARCEAVRRTLAKHGHFQMELSFTPELVPREADEETPDGV